LLAIFQSFLFISSNFMKAEYAMQRYLTLLKGW
jgi:hypothetical protein